LFTREGIVSQTLTVRTPRTAADQLAQAGPRRQLQLALAVLWLLDGILQLQPAMFGKALPQMLSATAQGNPALVGTPVTWAATLIAHHETSLNATFAAIQLALGLGIALRPTVKLALAASIAWSLSVWWLGEALGAVLTGTATLQGGAPGAVILYALLAVLLWPADRHPNAPFTAARAIGPHLARALWLLLWGSLAVLSALSTSTTAAMTSAQPAWLAWPETHAAALLNHPAPLAAALAAVALAVYLPPRAARPALILAIALSATLWLAQDLGGLLTGTATDPNSAPLLALLAVSFWPAAREA
jgi:hypothetical protein